MRSLGRYVAAGLGALALIAAACADGETAAPTGEGGCEPPPVKQEGTLTVAAEFPYYPPFMDGAQENPEGFEADVVNGIAERLGLDGVTMTNIAFDQLYAPGAKQWDIGISQITITEERDQAVDFSAPYFEANQGILVRADGQYAGATSTEDLLDAKFGAEAGTTGLDYIRENIRPTQPISEFDTTDAVAGALKVGTIDVQIIDVPIAIGIRDQSTDVELEVIGQYVTGEQYGMAMEEGSSLKPCVDAAIEEMRSDGTLEESQNQWLPGSGDLPEFQPAG